MNAVADDERVVERLAVGGERQHHRPPPRAHARAATCGAPRCGPRGCRCARRRPTCRCRGRRPARRPGAPASRTPWRRRRRAAPGSSGTRWPACGEQVQHAELGEHDLVPVGPGADDAGEAADAVGEGAGPGVDEPGGEVVPRGVAGERRVGEAGAQAVVEPAVELDEPAAQAGDALVALARRGRRPSGGRRRLGARPASARRRRRRGGAGGAPRAGACPSTQARDAGGRHGRPAPGPCTHITSSARACLHGCDRLGHEHRQARWAWSTIVSYGSRPEPRQRPHTARSSAPSDDPARRARRGRRPAAKRAGDGAMATTCSIVQLTRPTVPRGCHSHLPHPAPDPSVRRRGSAWHRRSWHSWRRTVEWAAVHPATVATAFATIFVAELPDKTMLATIVLSARFKRPLPVWIGAGVGAERCRWSSPSPPGGCSACSPTAS